MAESRRRRHFWQQCEQRRALSAFRALGTITLLTVLAGVGLRASADAMSSETAGVDGVIVSATTVPVITVPVTTVPVITVPASIREPRPAVFSPPPSLHSNYDSDSGDSGDSDTGGDRAGDGDAGGRHCSVGVTVADTGRADDGGDRCRARFIWPVEDATTVRDFDPPERPWLPGHRGVDIAAGTGVGLVAPADGVISFSGQVGGKSVVSIRHGDLTSTFEPAVGERNLGTVIRQGETFASVAGESDHCNDTCVHWGLKRADGSYANPAAQTVKRHVVLKSSRR